MIFQRMISTILVIGLLIIPTSNIYADSYSSALGRIQNLPKPRNIPSKLANMNSCEVNFISLLQGKLPAELAGNPAVNMWDELFDSQMMVEHIHGLKSAERVQYLEELARLSTNDEVYAKNLAEVVTGVFRKRDIDFNSVRKIFLNGSINDTSFFWSKSAKRITAQVKISEAKVKIVKDFVKDQSISKVSKKEYQRILTQSNLSEKQIQYAIDQGLEFKSGKRFIKQFEEYIEYLENLPRLKIRKGLKNVSEIYNFNFTPGKFSWVTLSPQKKFLVQQFHNEQFLDRRFIEIFNDMKLRERHDIINEIDDLVRRERAGEVIDPRERARLYKKLDDIELPNSLRERAHAQARGEAQILKKLRGGCNSGDSPVLKRTKKRFSRFKFALTLTSTPAFYYLKNKDKIGEDPYWFERLGYEMAMGIAFTFVANKIFTNGQTSFWRKYITSYAQFAGLDGVSSYGYEKLFGAGAMIRHVQKIYNPNTPDSEIEKKYQEMVNSPDAKKHVDELLEYLDKKSKDRNTKNFIDKYIHLSTHSSLTDEDRITIQDMESPEGKELLMELLAERLYLDNMGNNRFLQTGSHGADRWAFYRARNSLNDIKGLVLNLAIFQIMCREPFGKAGSWMAIMGLIMANELFSGDFTYQWRRDAINQ